MAPFASPSDPQTGARKACAEKVGALALLLAAALYAQAPPTFLASRVLPSNSDRSAPLAPGWLYSIYGEGLGPAEGCAGQADPKRLEKPAANAPAILQRFGTQLIYPTELCGVRVTVAGKPAGLLYVHAGQINFKVPLDAPLEGNAEIRVVVEGRASAPVSLPLGVPQPVLSVDGLARVGAPIWIHVEMPFGWGQVQYPPGIAPDDFGCAEVEVRFHNTTLPRIQIPHTRFGGIANGLRCGVIGIPYVERTHAGRLPLHVQYRLEQPGQYEVRFTQTDGSYRPEKAAVLFRSAWTPIVVTAAVSTSTTIQPEPSNPADLLSDYIPNLLATPNAATLARLEPILYHPEPIVRRFAAAALAYWPTQLVQAHLNALIRSKGPSDVIACPPELAPVAARHLQSRDPAILLGAIQAVATALQQHRDQLSAETIQGLESALLAAAHHVVQFADDQTKTNYAAALGSLKDARASAQLWEFVDRNVARDQSLIAITWRKDPLDLPRLGKLLVSFESPDPLNSSYSSLPYSLRNAYGEQAVPYLEDALRQSKQVWIRTNCARELLLAGRPSGFAFVLDAIEQNRPYKLEMVALVRGQFPRLQTAEESAVVAFLRQRSY